MAVGVGTLAGLDFDLKPVQAAATKLKIANATEVPSVCPYCAVGGAKSSAYAQDEIVNIEGNPESPISRGTLCPKGAATYQLAVNPNRITKVSTRAAARPSGKRGPSTGRWTASPIRQGDARSQLRRANRLEGKPQDGKREVDKRSTIPGHRLAGGATMDNEWNYVQAKLMRALGVVYIENQARI